MDNYNSQLEEEPEIPEKVLVEENLRNGLHDARNGKVGLSIEEVAEIISEYFDEGELQSLINSINNEHLQS